VDDPYKVLGVARDATQDEIKSAYRKLARSLHPDLNPGNKQAEEKFKKVSAAYDLLSDTAKRARFDAGEIDATGAERPRYSYRNYAEGGAGGKYSEGFRFGDSADDIFAELLRRRSKGRAGNWNFFDQDEGTVPVHGADAEYTLKLAFSEAAMGATKRITLPTGKHLDVKVPPGTKDGAKTGRQDHRAHHRRQGDVDRPPRVQQRNGAAPQRQGRPPWQGPRRPVGDPESDVARQARQRAGKLSAKLGNQASLRGPHQIGLTRP
jgi:DnaJ-class molecular chaperone